MSPSQQAEGDLMSLEMDWIQLDQLVISMERWDKAKYENNERDLLQKMEGIKKTLPQLASLCIMVRI